MTKRLSCGLLAAVAIMAGGFAMPAMAKEGGLAPHQMVRSLQLVQDRIAAGDHAALPMQNRLLEMTDERLRIAAEDGFEDMRDIGALLAFAMSGGNPATLEAALSLNVFDRETRRIGQAVLHYLKGDVGRARNAFSRIDPDLHDKRIQPFVFLVKAAVQAQDTPVAALDMLDRARLLAPGTLVEEAALRRSIDLAAQSDDLDRFLRASSQYARRFLRSPYAVQFAESFVNGIVHFATSITDDQIEAVVTSMNREQARTVYLRLARSSAIEGHAQLLDFAAGRASGTEDDERDARSDLYANISAVTSQDVTEVMRRLEDLDKEGLTQRDRRLLHAARAVAAEVIAPAGNGRSNPSADATGTEEALDMAEPDSQTDRGDGAAEAFVSSARSKLEEIDALLGRIDR